MKLILIAGKARSGKSLVAHLLKQMLEEKKLRVAITEYSKYIKLFAEELTNWDGISEPKPRAFLQNFGSFIRHEKNNNLFFIKRMKEDIEIYKNFVDILIISDVRLKEEIEEMGMFNPLTIYVQNDNNLYDLSEEEKGHETEHDLDNYKNFLYSIKNKTPYEIKEIVKDIILGSDLDEY